MYEDEKEDGFNIAYRAPKNQLITQIKHDFELTFYMNRAYGSLLGAAVGNMVG